MSNTIQALDIVKHLEKKLNLAIVADINSATAENPSKFDNDRETFRFRLWLDTGKYKGYDYLKRGAMSNTEGSFNQADISLNLTRKYVRYINGIVSILDSNIEGVSIQDKTNTANLTFTASVEFLIPLDNNDDDVRYTEEMVGSVRSIIDNAMMLNSYDDFGGYNMGVNYGIGSTGTRAMRGHIGDSITLSAAVNYVFVAEGVNSTEIRLFIDGIEVISPRKGYSRVASQEADIPSDTEDGASKNITGSTAFSINFDKPTQKTALDDIITSWLFDVQFNGQNTHDMVHLVTIIHPYDNEQQRIDKLMTFHEITESTEKALNASNTVIMVEAMVGNKFDNLSYEAEYYLENGEYPIGGLTDG